MGLNRLSTEFLLRARARGVNFARTLSIGRQNLYISEPDLAALLKQNAVTGTAAGEGAFADDFLRCLGADVADSMDVSDYEGATLIHDLNAPVPPDWHGRYDCVIDGGSLEHVFNFPLALKNCMDMVKVGGHLLIITPANNYCGHGFYQFSPELFWRTLSPENGFAVEWMAMLETEEGLRILPGGRHQLYQKSRPWHCVLDPDKIGRRAELINDVSVLLYVQARRTADVPIFAHPPQQSDYAATWRSAGASPPKPPRKSPVRRFVGSLVPMWVREARNKRRTSLKNESAFPLEKD